MNYITLLLYDLLSGDRIRTKLKLNVNLFDCS